MAEQKKEDDERDLVRDGKRQTEDGLVYEEKPCDEGLESIIPIASDFLDDETPRLVRVRAGHALPPTNGPIKLPGSDFLPIKPCTRHGVDACTDCFSSESLKNAFLEQQAKLGLLKSVEPDWGRCLSAPPFDRRRCQKTVGEKEDRKDGEASTEKERRNSAREGTGLGQEGIRQPQFAPAARLHAAGDCGVI